jgi:hypothetical protein
MPWWLAMSGGILLAMSMAFLVHRFNLLRQE